MTAPTHRQYAICFAFLVAIFLFKKNLTLINYYMALVILLLESKQGALFPDVDHQWKNVKEKTVPNYIINNLIHLTGGKHRSWQTHSLDIATWFAILSYYGPKMLYSANKISLVNREVMSIILLGFSAGWMSHMFSDMLNGVGIRLFFFSKMHIAFVPKHIGKFRFNTGNEWEAFCYKSTKIINLVLGAVATFYPLIGDPKISAYVHNLVQPYLK